MTSMSKCLVLLCLTAVLLASTGAFAALDSDTTSFIRRLSTNLGIGWDSTADPCTYSGVTCVDVAGDSTYQGVEIALSGRSLSGYLPDANGASYITKIDLSNNNGIKGNFPSSWASMTRVTDVDLSNTQLTGQIPDAWNGMVALQNIKISGTKACYRLPSWSGDKLIAIKTIDLSNNYIYGLSSSDFSAMASSKTLTSLNIDNNALCGCANDVWRGNAVMWAAAQSALPSSTATDCFAKSGAKCNNVNKCTGNKKSNAAAGALSTVVVAALAVATMVVTVVA